jgi:MFS family permease
MRRVLQVRDARIFLTGWFFSVFGDWAMLIVLAIWAKSLTHSNAAAGLTFFALSAPSLLSPLSGLVVDRVRRRPLLICTYTSEAVVVLSLLFVHDRGDVWILYAVAAFLGATQSLAASARSALMTVTIPGELLGDANGLFQSVREGMRLIAPLIGAAIYAATGGAAVAILDAASFAAVVAALLLMRTPEPRFERVEHGFVAEVTAGARHILATLPLKQIVFATAVCLLVVGFDETIIFAVVDQGLHRSPAFLGVLASIQGAGAIAGGVTAPRVLRRVGDVVLCGIGMAAFALGELAYVSSSLILVTFGIVVAGAGVSWVIVGFGTALQRRTPLRLQGRVASAAELFLTTQTLSIALGAALITFVDYRALVIAMTVVVIACAGYLVTRPVAESTRSPSEALPSPLPPSASPAPDRPATETTAAQAPDRAGSGPR